MAKVVVRLDDGSGSRARDNGSSRRLSVGIGVEWLREG